MEAVVFRKSFVSPIETALTRQLQALVQLVLLLSLLLLLAHLLFLQFLLSLLLFVLLSLLLQLFLLLEMLSLVLAFALLQRFHFVVVRLWLMVAFLNFVVMWLRLNRMFIRASF